MKTSFVSILLIVIPSIVHCEEASVPSRIDSMTKSARELMPTIPALPSVSLPSMPDLSLPDFSDRNR